MSVGGSPIQVLGVKYANPYQWTNITLTETGDNTGIFETTLVTGTEGHSADGGTVDRSMTLTYGNPVSPSP